jgi:hypothetical protein
MLTNSTRIPLAATAFAALALIAGCGSNSPTVARSSGHPTSTQQQNLQQAVVSFGDCMRAHGMPTFANPTTTPRGYKIELNPSLSESPAFQPALTACGRLLPGGGPHNQTDPYSPQRDAAMLAFAHCLRAHGFSNFPDPNGGGQITHQMLATDGIDIHNTALLQAADTCTSVTHGLLTKDDVAHFAAGQ